MIAVCQIPAMGFSRATAAAALLVLLVLLGGTAVAIQRGQADTACGRFRAVAETVERAERPEQGQGSITVEEAARESAEAIAACMQEQEDAASE
jgi:hypothetical protein